MSAPASISSGSTLASRYCRWINAPSASAPIVSSVQDVGLKKAFALGDDIAAVEPLQHNAREYEMRGRRSDVDPDRKHA
jgi:hypothetical protein